MVNQANKPNEPKKAGRPTDAQKMAEEALRKRAAALESRENLSFKGLEGYDVLWCNEDKLDYFLNIEQYAHVHLTEDEIYELIDNPDTAIEYNKYNKKRVGKLEDGSPQYAYLLARPKAVSAAIRAEKQKENDQLMEQIERGMHRAQGSEEAGYRKESAPITQQRR